MLRKLVAPNKTPATAISKTGETAATGAREYLIYTIQAGTVQDIVIQAQNKQTVQPYALVDHNVF